MGTLWSVEPLSGLLLRYEICLVLLRADRVMTVKEIVGRIEDDGFTLGGRPGKTVSDAIRWEVERDRIERRGWGRYGPGEIAYSTASRMRRRIEWARTTAAQVREMSLKRGVGLQEASAALGVARGAGALAAHRERGA